MGSSDDDDDVPFAALLPSIPAATKNARVLSISNTTAASTMLNRKSGAVVNQNENEDDEDDKGDQKGDDADDDNEDAPLINRARPRAKKTAAFASDDGAAIAAPAPAPKKKRAPAKKAAAAATTAAIETVRGEDDGTPTDAAAAVPAISVAAAQDTKKQKKTTSTSTTASVTAPKPRSKAAGTSGATVSAAKDAGSNTNNASNKKITDETQVQNMIVEMFTAARKPCGSQGVVDALGSKVSKVHVQRALDALVESQQIAKKDFKKISIFFPIVAPREPVTNSADAADPTADMGDEEKAELELLTSTLETLAEECSALDKNLKAQTELLQKRHSEVPIQIVEQNLQQLKAAVGELQDTISGLEHEENEQAAAEKDNNNSNNNSSSSGAINSNKKKTQRPLLAHKSNSSHNNNKTTTPLNEAQAAFLNMPLTEMVGECQRLRQMLNARRAATLDWAEQFCGERRPRDVFEELGLRTEDEILEDLKITDADLQLVQQVFSLSKK